MQARHPDRFGDDTFSTLPENLNCLIVQFRLCDLIHMLAKRFLPCKCNINILLF